MSAPPTGDSTQEARHLLGRGAALGAAKDEVVQVGQLVLLERGAHRLAHVLGLVGVGDAAARIDHGRAAAGIVRDQHIRLLEHRRIELGVLHRADVDAGLDPVGGIDVRPAVGRAQHHVGTAHGLAPAVARDDLDAGLAAHFLREGRAPLRVGTVAAHAPDLAHFEDRRDLRARLPATAEHRDLVGVRAREIARREPGGGGDAHALDHAVGQDRERLAGGGREQQHESDEAAARRRADTDLLGTPAGVLGPGQDFGGEPDRRHLRERRDAVHRFERIECVRAVRGRREDL